MATFLIFVVASQLCGQPPGEQPDPPERIAQCIEVEKLIKPVEITPKDSELQKLQKLRANVAAKEWELLHAEYAYKGVATETYLEAGRRLIDSRLAFANSD